MGRGLLLVSGPGRIEHMCRPLAMSQVSTSSSVTVTSALGPPAFTAVQASAELCCVLCAVCCVLCVVRCIVPVMGCTESTGLLAPSRMKRDV
jgi:hypothetical protein